MNHFEIPGYYNTHTLATVKVKFLLVWTFFDGPVEFILMRFDCKFFIEVKSTFRQSHILGNLPLTLWFLVKSVHKWVWKVASSLGAHTDIPSHYQSMLFCVQTLEKMSSQYQASYQEALAEYNSSKNRFPDKLPSEWGKWEHGKKIKRKERDRQWKGNRKINSLLVFQFSM